MADQIRSESVNVDQIMRQVRTRIAERQGVDYTESHVQQIASTRLDALLDPKNLRPELLEQFKRGRTAAPPTAAQEPAYTFEDATLFESTRAPLRWIRRLLLPVLKLFFNPNPLIQALHIQARLNVDAAQRDARHDQLQAEWNTLYYDVIRALVNEMSRTTLDTRSLKLKVESLQGRLDFAERRARALEEALQSRGGRTEARREVRETREPRAPREGREPREPRAAREPRPEHAVAPRPEAAAIPDTPADAAGPIAIEVPPGTPADTPPPVPAAGVAGTEPRRRRRRRRRGRRGGTGAAPGAPADDGSLASAPDGDEAEGDEAGDESDDVVEEQAARPAEHRAIGELPPGRPDDPEPSAQ